ncbi:MAG: phospholipid carrier-dependent glycosyltransferase [Candidatus Saccharibacteria bacterium]|nr:phospholipid carrier-dependent glycosyltransferase [Candidatus Saccharibacteria bacterium]
MNMNWYQRLLRYPELWILTIVAAFTRLWQLQLPPAVVFDEVYFRQFAANYLDGHYFFDIHPPFVKLLLAGAASMLHLSPTEVGGGDPAAVILRLIPAIAGIVLVPLIYVIIRQLGLGRRMATFGAILVLFDNALMVESRFILMDSLLLLAGFGVLSCYLALRRQAGNKRWLWIVIMAILIGLMVTTKWTGLAMAGLIATAWLAEGMMNKMSLRRMAAEAVATIVIVASIYVGSFAVHFALLTHSGEGDAFMSQEFQSTLTDSQYYKSTTKMSFWEKFIELNKEMYTAQSTLNGVQHPYASRWYSWPLELRPVYFWQSEPQKNNAQGNVYLLGNPVVWWGSTVAVVVALLTWLGRPQLLGERRRLVAFLLAGYALNFVPFAFIDRPMFLYHYLFALLFAILITCVLIGRFFDWQALRYGRRAVRQTYWAVVVVIVLGFLYFLPLSYGWSLSPADLQQRIWLPSWR